LHEGSFVIDVFQLEVNAAPPQRVPDEVGVRGVIFKQQDAHLIFHWKHRDWDQRAISFYAEAAI
jgi:hypothetical protein